MGLSETVWEMQEEINQLRADRDKWKRLYETVVVKDEGMQLYEEIERLKDLLHGMLDRFEQMNPGHESWTNAVKILRGEVK